MSIEKIANGIVKVLPFTNMEARAWCEETVLKVGNVGGCLPEIPRSWPSLNSVAWTEERCSWLCFRLGQLSVDNVSEDPVSRY